MNAPERFVPGTGRRGRIPASLRGRRFGVPAVGSSPLLKADRPRAIDRYIDYFGADSRGGHLWAAGHREPLASLQRAPGQAGRPPASLQGGWSA
jgi:hypothetical protein